MAAHNHGPIVQFIGEIDHPDFDDVMELLRSDAQLVAATTSPELIIVAQSRPDTVGTATLNRLRQAAPLSGIVALLGSWCEGETRTGKPWPGVHRYYWYEFPAWWRRQISLRAAGRCPDWARPWDCGKRIADCGLSHGEAGSRRPRPSLVVLRTARRATAEALADVLEQAGYSTVWQLPGRHRPFIRGAVAGIWDGGQLNDVEGADLAAFRAHMANDAAPVLALLDFPRRDRVNHALEIGAAAVVGKPWFNSELMATLETMLEIPECAIAA